MRYCGPWLPPPAIRRQSWKSALTVPLLRNGEALGSISLGSALAGGSSDSQVEFDGALMLQRVFLGGDPEARARLVGAFPRPPGPETMPGRAILSGRIVHVSDVQADAGLFQPGRGFGARAFLTVPLMREGKAIGALGFTRFDPGEFDRSAIELVRAFAEQAVIALSSAAALWALRERTDELQEALEQQTAMADVLRIINETPGGLAPVFDTILEKAHALCGATMGAMVTLDGANGYAVATRGYSTASDRTARRVRPPPRWIEPLLRPDVRCLHFPDMTRIEAVMADPFGRTLALENNARTYLAVPLRKEARLLGFITVIRAEVRPFTEKEIGLLESFGAQAVVAMENARLFPAVQYFEEASKGTIEPGKLADFVILSDNPLTVKPEDLIKLKVVETIKEGTSVYKAG